MLQWPQPIFNLSLSVILWKGSTAIVKVLVYVCGLFHKWDWVHTHTHRTYIHSICPVRMEASGLQLGLLGDEPVD